MCVHTTPLELGTSHSDTFSIVCNSACIIDTHSDKEVVHCFRMIIYCAQHIRLV